MDPQRRYDLDWLRFIAIAILLLFHTGMLFNPWEWHIKNTETSESFRYWMIWLHQWRMPLLLFISGAGTYIALGKRTFTQFAGERFRRLFIPLVFGMFVVVPPQIYFEHILEYSSYLDFYPTVFNFIPYPEGSFSWHHLWFILYLFLYSLLAIPVLRFLKSADSSKFKNKVFSMVSRSTTLLFIPVAIILITQVVLRPFFSEETHALIDDWAYFVHYFCFFLFGIIAYSSDSIWDAIRANRNRLLLATILALIPFYGLYFHFREFYQIPLETDMLETLFDVVTIFVSWFTVITVIAYGQQYLNHPHPWLSKINEGLYPFYILHQTVIIWIGYYICQLDWSISAKFFMVSFLTLISCVGVYLLLIRPFNSIRFLFGMKKKTIPTP